MKERFLSTWGGEVVRTNFRDTRSLASSDENQRMRVGIAFRRASFRRDRSRLIRIAFPRCATCIPTMHVGWKPLRADARARFLALGPCQLPLLHPTSAWFIFHLLSMTCSGEIPIFLSAFRPQMSVGRIRTSTPVRDLYEFRNFPTFFTRTVVRARHRVIMILLRAHSNT